MSKCSWGKKRRESQSDGYFPKAKTIGSPRFFKALLKTLKRPRSSSDPFPITQAVLGLWGIHTHGRQRRLFGVMMVSSSILGHPSHAVGNGQTLFPAWTVTALSKEESDAHSSNQGNRRHREKSKVCTADIFSALKQCPTLAMSLSSSGVRKTLDAPPPPGEAAAEAILRQERSPQALSLALTSRAVCLSLTCGRRSWPSGHLTVSGCASSGSAGFVHQRGGPERVVFAPERAESPCPNFLGPTQNKRFFSSKKHQKLVRNIRIWRLIKE